MALRRWESVSPTMREGESLQVDESSAKERFEQTALRELPTLYRIARRLAGSEEAAEDLVGQALLSAAKAWQSFDGRYARSWLITILRNEHRQNIRRGAVRPQTAPLLESHIADEDTWREISSRSEAEQALCELDKLPEEFRIAVALCDVEGMSYEEAATAMNCRPGTLRSRLFRGRRMLRERLLSKGNSDVFAR
jgi:RNA polymerase sigma-70 factor, ECF subfamily